MTTCIPSIVLTGGPGGGKSTLMRELRSEDPECRKWVLVPEVAPLLFQAGLSASEKAFQAAAVRVQMALEDACALAAPAGSVLVCDRGTLDPLAYWLRKGWEQAEFFAITGMTAAEHCHRYAAIFHLQTAAIGAEPHYRRWPHSHRSETPDEAAEIDALCAHAWSGHRHQFRFTNSDCDWVQKAHDVRKTLSGYACRRSQI